MKTKKNCVFAFLLITIFLKLTCLSFQQGITPFGTSQFLQNRLTTWRAEELLPAIYNNQQAPFINETAIKVLTHLRLLSLHSLTYGNTHKIELMLTQKWNDYRLQSPRYLPYTKQIILDRRWQEIIWVPLIYIKNTLSEDRLSFSQPIVYLSITNRSQVQLSSILSIEIKCNYNNLNYPVDKQECNLEFITVSQTQKEVELVWKSFDVDQIHNSQFKVSKTENKSCVFENDSANFSCLKASIYLEPNVSSCLFLVYIPTFFLVIICFAGFWTPRYLYSARISLIFIPLLVLINERNYIIKNGCNTYSLAIWLIVCIMFICSSLFQYIVTLNDEWSSRFENLNFDFILNFKYMPFKTLLFKEWFKSNQNNNAVDMISRIFFPFTFIIFIFVYILCFAF